MDLEHLMVTIGSVKNKYYIWSRSGGFIWDEVKAPPFENEKKNKEDKKNRERRKRKTMWINIGQNTQYSRIFKQCLY